jgi:hypothetical protein
MKKCFVLGIALCLSLLLAVPVMALETEFSGSYRVRGFHNSNQTLNDNDSDSSYFDMRFRLLTNFMVSDHLMLTTRLDALDNKRFGRGDLGDRDRDNIDFDRAFMTIRSDYGTFMAGRLSGGTWGTSYGDTDSERDRIRWHDTFGNITLYAIYEKGWEGDGNLRGYNVPPDRGQGTEVSDEDNDSYFLGIFHKAENISSGLLYGYFNNKRDRDFRDRFHFFNPFAIGQFGPLGFQGEVLYQGFGDRKFADDRSSRDFDRLSFNVEGNYTMDMFQFELGYAYARGQGRSRDIKGAPNAIGNDWQKLWILTGSEDDGVATNLGGLGNLSAENGQLANNFGAQILYGGITVMPMEKMDVKFMVGYARADKTPSGVDKNYGWEYDLFLNYKIFDNLRYSFIAAYLDAGDFWKEVPGGVESRDLNDNFHLFHALTLSF